MRERGRLLLSGALRTNVKWSEVDELKCKEFDLRSYEGADAA